MSITDNKKQTRNSTLELLRVISMLVIIACHYVTHSGAASGAPLVNRVWLHSLTIGGKLGVNCFVLISAYFICTQTKYKWSRIIKTILQVTLYSVLMNIALLLIGGYELSFRQMLVVLFPVLYGEWWFATTYCALLLIAPLLSRLIAKTDRKLHLKIIILFAIVWSVIPTVTNVQFEYSDLIWFVFLFFVAAYIRKYPLKYINTAKRAGVTALISMAFIVAAIAFNDVVASLKGFWLVDPLYFTKGNMVLMLILSVSLFILFLKLPERKSKFVNTAAGAMLGAYLIHDYDPIRYALWKDIFKTAEYASSDFLILHTLISVAAVFVGCTVIGVLFNFVFDRLLGKCSVIFEKAILKLTSKVNSFIDKLAG